LENAFKVARSQISAQHRRQKRTYDQRQHGQPFKPGDFVWVYNQRFKKRLTTKLGCNWLGPYLVLKRLSDTVNRIQKSKTAKPIVIHYDRMKLYRGEKVKSWIVEDVVPEVMGSDEDNEDPDATTGYHSREPRCAGNTSNRADKTTRCCSAQA
jgi:hypothetical protein